MSAYNAKKFADNVIDSFTDGCSDGLDFDGCDPLSVGDEMKATFNVTVYHNENGVPFKHKPVGVITYKVTVEATYQAYEEDE